MLQKPVAGAPDSPAAKSKPRAERQPSCVASHRLKQQRCDELEAQQRVVAVDAHLGTESEPMSAVLTANLPQIRAHFAA